MIKASDPQVRDRVLKRVRLRFVTKPPIPIGAGAWVEGNVLLVGERTSHPEVNKYHLPFCSIKGCSGWLNALLSEAEIPEERLFWINALDNDGTPVNLGMIYHSLKPSTIIALGNVASEQLHKQGIVRHALYPHPQYWKRFKSKHQYPLIPFLSTLLYEPTTA